MSKTRQDEDVRGKPYLADLLKAAGGRAEITDLFGKADLPVSDFYAQLAWEVKYGLIIDEQSSVVSSPRAPEA